MTPVFPLTQGLWETLRNEECEPMGGRIVNMGKFSESTLWFDPPWLKQPVKPERVIFNGPATIVLWSDGKKTVVKCHNEPFDYEKGLAMAIVKRFVPRADFNRLLNDELDRRVKRTHKGGKG